MTPWPTSDLFFTRTGMDRGRVQQTVDRRAEGRRRRGTVPGIPPDRIVLLRRRPAEGGHLRHHPGLRPARGGGRSHRLCPCHRDFGRRDRARRRHGAGRGAAAIPASPRPPRPHQHQALYRHRSAGDRRLREEGEAAGGDERLCARPRTAACARCRLACRANGSASRSCAPAASIYSRHPPAGPAQRLGGGRRGWPPGIRQLRRRRPQRL